MDITLILSMLTTLFALISPPVTALINNHAAYKQQSSKLYFEAKLEAYQNYLAVSSSVSYPLKTDEFQHLQDVYSSALVFASREVQNAISADFSVRLNCPAKPSTDDIQKLSNTRADVLFAIQHDLESFK